MLHKPRWALTVEDARQLIDHISREVSEGGLKRVSIVVTDDHGNVIASHRMNGASPDSMVVAELKAMTAARRRVDTSELATWSAANLNGLRALNPRYITWQGGVVLVDPEGNVVGGLGVSGEKSKIDEELGHNARAALSLAPAPKEGADSQPLTVVLASDPESVPAQS